MSNEKKLLYVLAAVQFSHIMDFMVIMPLGPQLMTYFNITPQQFGFLVASYSLTAFISNITMSFFADNFDRKTLLIGLYIGFLLGTLACGLAPSFPLLLAARSLTGLFGGLLSAVVFSIVGDTIPGERRATAMGIVMTGFSLASVAGVPMGLYLASQFSWHMPFLSLVGFGAAVLLAIYVFVPSLTEHLSNVKKLSPFHIFQGIANDRSQQFALLLNVMLIMGQFTVIPMLANYLVLNLGFTEQQTALPYLVGGAFTIITAPRIGRWADRIGKPKVFTIMTVLSTIPLFLLTNLPVVPLAVVLAVTTLFFITISGRMVPASAMIISTVPPESRGGFMNISSATVQLSSGLASTISGLIVTQSADKQLQHYNIAGFVAIGFTLLAIYVGNSIDRHRKPAPVPVLEMDDILDAPSAN